MTEEQSKTNNSEPDAALAGADSQKRERSTIQFPYNDLNDAVTIAKAIHENAGGSCTLDQLAAYINQSMKSGAFRLRVSAARNFGLTVNERGEVRLTELGRKIVDPTKEANARAAAFMQVPLYERVYENHRGYTLPPAAALEKFMRGVGVSSKQTDKARQVFMRSAKQAGFFAHGEDRLVRPSVGRGPGTKPIEEIKPAPDAKPNGGNGGGDDGGSFPPDIDPIIAGLLERLPKPGSVWPEAERKRWVDLLSGSFWLIYESGDKPNESADTERE